ncbi:hypothetical protein [Deinococcus petrolearius]|uniref:Uncharacterized protein n=1 Tax=Deinococcus petrolearius TaxID=1751295 RepID=A0ABW1DMS1_9DEIO
MVPPIEITHRHIKQFLGAWSSGNKQAKESPVTVTGQRGQELTPEVVRQGPRRTGWLFLPVEVPSRALKGIAGAMVRVTSLTPEPLGDRVATNEFQREKMLVNPGNDAEMMIDS